LAQEVSFLNKASIKQTLNNLPANSKIIIDASASKYIDFDVLDIIRDFYNTRAADNNIEMSLIGFKEIYDLPVVEKQEDSHAEIGKDAKVSSGNNEKLLSQLNNKEKE
jgi:MFS superfamily sulfate permease-like transporter